MLLIFDMNFCMILLGMQDSVEMGLLYYSNTRSTVPFTALIWALVTTWPVKQLSSFTISLLAALQTDIIQTQYPRCVSRKAYYIG